MQGALAHGHGTRDGGSCRFAFRQAPGQEAAYAKADRRRVHLADMFIGNRVMDLGQQIMGRRQREHGIGARQQQRIRGRVESQGTVERVPVGLQIGGRRQSQLQGDGPEITRRDPAAERQEGHEVEAEALPGHGLPAGVDFQGEPEAFGIVVDGHEGGIIEDADIAGHPFQYAEKVRRGHHAIGDHIEAGRLGDLRARESQSGIARAGERQPPEVVDLVA